MIKKLANLNELEFKNACFIKIGCYICRRYREMQFLYYGETYKRCKDEFLSYEEKIHKLNKYNDSKN